MKTPLSLALLAAISIPAHAQAIKIAIKRLPQETIQSRLKTVVPDFAGRLATLESLFEQLACRDERLATQNVPLSSFPNLICTLPGSEPTAGTIVATAHFDHIGGGMGVVDDWSGAVLLPSLYESLALKPRRHTFVFVAFSAEHRHLAGSTE